MGTFKFSDSEAFDLTLQAKSGLTRNDVILDGDSTDQVLNYNNAKDSTLFIRNIVISNGNSSSNGGGIYVNDKIDVDKVTFKDNSIDSFGYGAGFYASRALVVKNSIFFNNRANDNSGKGGGFYTYSSTVIVEKCTFESNFAGEDGGGFHAHNSAEVSNTVFKNNKSRLGGGLFSLHFVAIKDSDFIENSASLGGGIYTKKITVSNSDFIKNTASKGGGFKSEGTTTLINNIFDANIANEGSAYLSSFSYPLVINNLIKNHSESDEIVYGKGTFVNNIFLNNKTDINLISDAKFFNNYIDYLKIENLSNYSVEKKNNIQPSEGTINFSSDLEHLESDAIVINKGLNPTSSSFKNLFSTTDYEIILNLLATDKDDKGRISGGTIDMGPYEVTAAPEIIINSKTIKVLQSITLIFTSTLSEGAKIDQLYIDNGNGTLVTQSNTTLTSFNVEFDTSGSKTVRVKVVDSNGLETTQSLTLNVLDMTMNEAIEYGKQLCKNSPSSCGIEGKNPLTQNEVEKLSSGWHLLGSRGEIRDMSLFNSAQVLWTFQNGTMKAYSPSATTMNALRSDNVQTFSTLEEADAVWLLK